MTKRNLLTALMFLTMLFPAQTFAQAAGGGGESILGLPILTCRVETTVDSLYFDDDINDYSPNRITMTVWVRNIGETGASPKDTAVARGITVSVRQDTRFNIDGVSFKSLTNPVIGGDSLRFGDSAAVTFEMTVASPRATDGIDEVAAIVVSDNANHTTCTKDIWVEHVYYPVFRPLCTKGFGQIVWDDDSDDYNPNPFTINLIIENIGDGASDSTIVFYIGTPDVSMYEADSGSKYLGTILPGESKSTEFLLRPSRRSNDTTLSLCFQIRGKGGYKSEYYIDTCCVEVFIPASKQAEYALDCDINVDFVEFTDHAYNPNPFLFTVDIQNVGTAVGKDVKATIGLPPGIQLAAGETLQTKPVGDMNPNGTATVTWELSPTTFFERDTLDICVTVFDAFDNRATCCDSVIIDSVRKAIFDVVCECPDTIYADTQQGVYINSPFDVFFHVRNVGSDYADSVKATVIIQGSNINTLNGFPTVQPKEIVDTWNFADTLSVDGGFTFTWPMEATPIAQGTIIRLVFKVEAKNGEPQECVCEIFVQRLDSPNLDVLCETIPSDSLHFDPRTGGYFPSFVIYRVCATNIGGGIARNVQANLAIAPSMVRADGEPEIKFYNPSDLGPGDTACVEWMLIPVKRTTTGLNAQITSETIAENLEERSLCSSSIFIPALPKTAALAIPRNNVGYTDQTILVPIFIDDPEGKDIKKFEIELLYNHNPDRTRMTSDVVEFMEIVTPNSLTGSWNIVSQGRNANNDQLNFIIESTTPLEYPPAVGDNVPPLVWLKFRAVFGSRPDELDWTTTPVLWPEATAVQSLIRINDGSIFPRVTDGLITVSGDCLRPLTASPDYVIFNKPNPFNPVTTITYSVPVDEHVRVTVFDALGREVDILVDEYTTAGTHAVMFDAKGLTSGIYFYRMDTPQFSTMKKMVVTK